ncbi:chromatin assembly factor 1 subunit P60 [Encephalitozoon intestinalis ATCC 50506]|uniref:Chromatin assembly factor 1 subunit P60 n=1 Tax=Encephalitozoon intestinalis (strain ATCC 50506) TaxID=876142 RepID=E0S8U1_ENCIT|nr:chromatin assembly factor 1 subunit P60 [Encephalitozoon intestinalis ATCC 50506]ADM12058.1 chromatin assembly factor 1 subunit P60 [Encephalitozoon intestinalis ATCC 50506]UTX45848.1 WD40 domain-containing protein [Encephalitozoon intestinalis]
MENLEKWYPIEVTTHNLHFHEEASIFTMHGNEEFIATGGGDKDIRLWRVEKSASKNKDFCYTTAANSSIKIRYHTVLSGHHRSVNCVRFQGDLLASCSDGGEVILWSGEKPHVVRRIDGDDAYELVWGNGHLFVGFSSGNILVYQVTLNNESLRGDENHSNSRASKDEDEKKKDWSQEISTKLVQKVQCHGDIIQGLAFNHRFGVLTSLSKDRTGRTFVFTDKLVAIEKMEYVDGERLFTAGRGFFRRFSYSPDGKLLYLACCKSNTVAVLHYPFRMEHMYGTMGPFDSEPLRIMCDENKVFIATKKNLYVFADQKLEFCVENISFMTITDGWVFDGICFLCSLDGFLSSLSMKR